MKEPNSFGNPEFLKDLAFISDQLSTVDARQPGESPNIFEGDELPHPAVLGAGEESSLNQELERVCFVTGATGAAIALVRGENIVCCATAGSKAPDIGLCLDPHSGLSGACFQSRQLQTCSDTQTDPRVDPEACRRLGVRSIVVLPLIEGDELFGIVEILSSEPNAFGERDLDTLKILTDRIVESRKRNSATEATAPRNESARLKDSSEEVVLPDNNPSSGSDSGFPRRERNSRRNDLRVIVLGSLVIGSALLLGTLVGWRLGWQKAALAFRFSSTPYRANAKNARTDATVFSGEALPSSSAETDECGQSQTAGPTPQPRSGELTVCQDGRVIFRLPTPAPPPARGLQTTQRSPDVKANPVSRQ